MQEVEQENTGLESPESSEPEPRRVSMGKAFLSAFMAAVLGAAVMWAGVGYKPDQNIPEPYRGEIVKLRDANTELQKRLQDLQRDGTMIAAQQQWNAARINTLSGQALEKLGLQQGDYFVDMTSLKVKPTKK